MEDFACSGLTWQTLAHAPPAWKLRIATSEVVIAEVLAGHQRQALESLSVFSKLSKAWNRLGAEANLKSSKATFEFKVSNYAGSLLSALQDAGVEILPAPEVPHIEVVSRSVSRRRPCNQNGDGYRDTLLWLTVLKLAQDQPDEEIVFISNDNDFRDENKTGFHPDLLDDLSEVDAQSRVSLGELLETIFQAAERSPESQNLPALRDELQDKTVRQFISALVPEVTSNNLSLRETALPNQASAAYLHRLWPAGKAEYTLRGSVGEDEAVAEFSYETDSEIYVTTPAATALDASEGFKLVSSEPEELMYRIIKPLIFEGILKLGRYNRPLSGEITRIVARSDDPGHKKWLATEKIFFDTSLILNAANALYHKGLFDPVKLDIMRDMFPVQSALQIPLQEIYNNLFPSMRAILDAGSVIPSNDSKEQKTDVDSDNDQDKPRDGLDSLDAPTPANDQPDSPKDGDGIDDDDNETGKDDREVP